jgi:tetratricopeptide (TPR) repeat protein
VAELGHASVEMFRELDNPFGLGWALHLEGLALAVLGRSDEAETVLREAMRIFLPSDDRSALALLVGDLSILAESRGNIERALRMAGAAERIEEEIGTGLLGSDTTVAKRLRQLKARLPAAEAEPLLAEGRAMSVEDALAFATEWLERPDS